LHTHTVTHAHTYTHSHAWALLCKVGFLEPDVVPLSDLGRGRGMIDPIEVTMVQHKVGLGGHAFYVVVVNSEVETRAV